MNTTNLQAGWDHLTYAVFYIPTTPHVGGVQSSSTSASHQAATSGHADAAAHVAVSMRSLNSCVATVFTEDPESRSRSSPQLLSGITMAGTALKRLMAEYKRE